MKFYKPSLLLICEEWINIWKFADSEAVLFPSEITSFLLFYSSHIIIIFKGFYHFKVRFKLIMGYGLYRKDILNYMLINIILNTNLFQDFFG